METVPFRKISTPRNQVKLRYFSQCKVTNSIRNGNLKTFYLDILECQKRIFDKRANIEGNDFFFFVIMELLLPA